MKNFSGITDNLDITTKKYVDDSLASKANLAGNNTFTGGQRITGADGGYSINASGYVRGSWLQSSVMQNKGSNTGKVCVFDDAGWVYYRTPKEVIIDAECAVKYEVKKNIDFGDSGALYIGKFKVYDTNVTCEITSTTSVTYSGKLVIATQNYAITQMTVYGDAANTVTPNIFIKPSSESDPYIEVYFKPASWSKNVIHIYGSAIMEAPTDVCTNVSAVPTTATQQPINALNSKANLSDTNNFTGSNAFIGQNGQTSINGSNVSIQAVGAMGSAEFSVKTDNNNKVFEVISDADNGAIYLNRVINIDNEQQGNVPLCIGGTNAGASGQVLTSQGTGETPSWTTLPITSATLDVANKTLYLTLPSGS
jgi:hypothetical protein